jgi:hypothetical protein
MRRFNSLAHFYFLFAVFALLSTSCGLLEEEEATGPKPFPGKRWGPTMPIDREDNHRPYSIWSIAIQGDYVYATTRDALYRTTYPDSSD